MLPKSISDLEQELSPLAVEFVAFARQSSGDASRLTGTLSENASGQFSYSAIPADRMKVVFSDGSTIELVFSTFTGDLSGGVRAFYKGNHLMQYGAKFKAIGSIGDVNLNLRSQRIGIALAVKIGGTAQFAGGSHNLNLDYAQRLISDFGPGSIEFHHADTLKGSIAGPSAQIQVNESYDFKLVGSNSLVLQTIQTLGNTWTEAGQQFSLPNGLIKKVFRDGKPIEADFWTAQGDLLRGGVKVGGLGQAFTGNLLEQFLDTPSGRIRLSTVRFE
jgi:hypothetical protein